MRRLSTSRLRGNVTVPFRARRASESDGGFSLIEVMVGLVLITIVFSALASLLITALHSTRVNELRVKAHQVGQQVLEDARAIPWDDAGFYADDAGHRSTFDGATTVTLDATRPVGAKAPTPLATHDIGGLTYDTRTDIVWVDDPSNDATDTDPQDLKRIYVEVTWSNKGQDYSLTVRADRAPTADEVTPAGQGALSPYAVESVVAAPSEVTIDGAGKTTSAIRFDVTMSAATSQVRLSWMDRTSTTHTALMLINGDTRSWTYTVPIGAGPFDVGEQAFSVRAFGAADVTADGQAQVLLSTSSGGLSLTQPVVAPSAPDITASGALTADLTVTSTASSPVTSMTLTYTTRSGSATTVPMILSGGVDGSYTFAAGSCCFPDGASTFTVTAQGNGMASQSAQVIFTPPTTPEVSIIDATFDDEVCVANSGNPRMLKRAVTLTVRAGGLAADDSVSVQLNDDSAQSYTLDYVSASDDISTFRRTFEADTVGWPASDRNSVVVSAYAHRGADLVATSDNLIPTPSDIVQQDKQTGVCP